MRTFFLLLFSFLSSTLFGATDGFETLSEAPVDCLLYTVHNIEQQEPVADWAARAADRGDLYRFTRDGLSGLICLDDHYSWNKQWRRLMNHQRICCCCAKKLVRRRVSYACQVGASQAFFAALFVAISAQKPVNTQYMLAIPSDHAEELRAAESVWTRFMGHWYLQECACGWCGTSGFVCCGRGCCWLRCFRQKADMLKTLNRQIKTGQDALGLGNKPGSDDGRAYRRYTFV